MPELHWTYSKPDANADLQQGDIIRPSAELSKVLKEIHPHFDDPKYIGYVIITQSCDLARRSGKSCTSRYINIAVVREIDAILDALLDPARKQVHAGIYLKQHKEDARNLISRLISQNEQNLGLFYLHPEPEMSIIKPSVALLRVTAALRREHYELLVSSRSLSLKPEFQAKLGWLAGNLFSRVGTTDWNEDDRQKARDELIKKLLREHENEQSIYWFSKDAVDNAKSLPESGTREDFIRHCKSFKKVSMQDAISESLKKHVRNVIADVSDEQLRKLAHLVRSDADLKVRISQLERET